MEAQNELPLAESRESRSGSPSFEVLQSWYQKRTRSTAELIGAALLVTGMSAAGLAAAFLYSAKDRGQLESGAFGWAQDAIPLGAFLFALGIIVLLLDYLKRRLVAPYRFEVENDFLRFCYQEGLFPAGMAKEQFRCKAKGTRKHYVILFRLDIPGSSLMTLEPHIRRIAAAFGCPERYILTENFERASKYLMGYRYRLDMVFESDRKAFDKAGEYRD